MPISLAQIIQNTAKVTFQVGDNPDDTLTVEYYPRHVTDKELLAILSFDSLGDEHTAEKLAGLNDMLASLIKDWDLYEDPEMTIKVPITAERFSRLYVDLRAKMISAIASNIRPEAAAPQAMN